jgi:2-keto-4-pentenoate hydratase
VTAYAVQDETLRRRLARGERLVGVKLGLTSRAKQQRMNISSPLVAWLTDAMVLPAGAPVPRGRQAVGPQPGVHLRSAHGERADLGHAHVSPDRHVRLLGTS